MSNGDTCNLLFRLLEAGERLMVRPSRAFLGASDAVAAELLLEEVRTFAAKPAPDGRMVGDYELLLAQVLLMASRAQGLGERVMVLSMVAGVLLPAVREDLSKAIDARRHSVLKSE